jgi:CubicO group peptidase (beta-lactamase class C family)
MELLFTPGEGWSYSSYGYSALGAIIAAVTGEPFERYMAEQWLAPLGMTQSTFVTKDVDPAAQMTGYVSDNAGKATPTEVACDGRDASPCTLWSNCEDMVKYAQFMLNNGEVDGSALLQPSTIAAMWTPLSATGWAEMNGPHYGPPLQDYGLGWVLGAAAGHRLVGHPGGLDGYNSQILLAPDDGLAVIAMDNWLDLAAVPAFPASMAATDVLYLLLGIEPEAQ